MIIHKKKLILFKNGPVIIHGPVIRTLSHQSKRLLVNIILFGTLITIANGFRLSSNILMFQRLSESEFGVLSFELTTYVVLSVILSAGMEINFVRKSAGDLSISKSLLMQLNKLKVVQLGLSLPILMIIFVSQALSSVEFLIVFLAYGGRVYFNLYVAFFSTLNVRWKAGLGDLLREFILFVIILTGVQDPLHLIIAIALCEFVGLALLVILALKSILSIRRDDLISWETLFESSGKLTALQLVTYSRIYLCMFFIQNNELGVFSYANSFSGILGIITAIIATTTFPHYASIVNTKSWKESLKEIRIHTFLLLGFSIIILTVLIVVPGIIPFQSVLRIININPSIYLLIVVQSVYYLLTIIMVPIFRFLMVIGWDKEILAASVSGLFIQVTLLFILAKLAIWASLSLIAGMILIFFILLIFLKVKDTKNLQPTN